MTGYHSLASLPPGGYDVACPACNELCFLLPDLKFNRYRMVEGGDHREPHAPICPDLVNEGKSGYMRKVRLPFYER